jgi:glycosyltransferase involved in cell wall biosynthesis
MVFFAPPALPLCSRRNLMRVALLSYNAQAADAIGNQVAEKLAFFLERGADVRLFVQSGQRLHSAVRPHCRILPAAEPRGEAWRFLASADLVVVEYGQYYRLLELLPLLAGGKGRVLFDYHGVTPAELWPTHNREAIEAGARQRGLVWAADAALAHSLFTREELRQATAFPAERCFCLGHPVDLEHFRPGPAVRPLAETLGAAGAFMVLFVGRLAPNKRLPILVEALARLRDVQPPVHAAVVGDAGDAYEPEARRCRELATVRGVGDRLHWLGQVSEDALRDALRSADVLVMPSCHEGFCIPVIEAMACGLPVVAARKAALPATVAGAGLTFNPDDPGDLERQLRRLLEARGGCRVAGGGRGGNDERSCLHSSPLTTHHSQPLRVALVAFRYGTGFAGGAERSLRTMAQILHQAGRHVEVFTTCTLGENNWGNEASEGTTVLEGIPVHRYRLDAHDRAGHLAAVQAVLQADGAVSLETERLYLEHSIHSSRLLEALHERLGEFEAIITGPYLFGLTLDVARAFPDRTLLLPCFHDEPFARLRAWTEYERVGGVLYHSPEEQAFAEGRLGINHPGGVCIGGLVAVEEKAGPEPASVAGLAAERYLLYCGRYSAQKALPELLDFARRYAERHPDRFAFCFIGQGEVAIPRHPRMRDLGFVPEDAKRGLLAGADALLQLSRYESLSYAALEAWAEGTPLIAARRCEVLAGHLRRCGGGRGVDSFEDFAGALDDLWDQPRQWQMLGEQGREYVSKEFGARSEFCRKIEDAIRSLTVPLAERMGRRGLERAAEFARPVWRERFAELVEQVLDAGPRPFADHVEVRARSATRAAAAGSGTVLVPVRVVNRGSHVLLADGPGRGLLRYGISAETGQPVPAAATQTPLPGLVMPGRALAAVVPVAVPAVPGEYRVIFWAERIVPNEADPFARLAPLGPGVGGEGGMKLIVEGPGEAQRDTCCGPFLDAVQADLGEAQRRQDLPCDYLDVTEGWLAGLKRRIKRKLLGNFKHAYVDVLSRQQSAFNRLVLAALEELAECCATLDHGMRPSRGSEPPPGAAADELAEVRHQLAENRERCALLEERLARLEVRIQEQETLAAGG